MKRHLNKKNKLFMGLFVIIILAIIGILIYSVKLTGYKNNTIYTISDNHVLFADDYIILILKMVVKLIKLGITNINLYQVIILVIH